MSNDFRRFALHGLLNVKLTRRSHLFYLGAATLLASKLTNDAVSLGLLLASSASLSMSQQVSER